MTQMRRTVTIATSLLLLRVSGRGILACIRSLELTCLAVSISAGLERGPAAVQSRLTNTDIGGVTSPAAASMSPDAINTPSPRSPPLQDQPQAASSVAPMFNMQPFAAFIGPSTSKPSIRQRSAPAAPRSPSRQRDTIVMQPMRPQGAARSHAARRGSPRRGPARSGSLRGGSAQLENPTHITDSPPSIPEPLDSHTRVGLKASGKPTQRQQAHPGTNRRFNLLDPDLPDSEFAEVRGSVSNIDITTDPCSTIRMWMIAFIIITVSAAANTYWTYRAPSPTITLNVAILIAWPLGRAAAAVLPDWGFRLPKFIGGERVTLNPGAWSMKEHSLIAQMAIVSLNANVSYPVYALTVQQLPVFWNNNRGEGYAMLFAFSTAFLGIGLGGVCRRFLVRPASMLWPQNLQASLLLNVLFAKLTAKEDKARFTRVQWFVLVVAGAFVWNFFPSFIFTSLSAFAWITWLAPSKFFLPLPRLPRTWSLSLSLTGSVPVNYLFGYRNGIALLPFTLDWSQITYLGSPLITPWWAAANTVVGFVVMTFIVSTALYFGNVSAHHRDTFA